MQTPTFGWEECGKEYRLRGECRTAWRVGFRGYKWVKRAKRGFAHDVGIGEREFVTATSRRVGEDRLKGGLAISIGEEEEAISRPRLALPRRVHGLAERLTHHRGRNERSNADCVTRSGWVK